MPVKKSIRLEKFLRVYTSTASKQFTRLAGRIGARKLVLIMMCAVAAAMLIAAYRSSKPAEIASAGTQQAKPAAQGGTKTAAATAPASGSVAARTRAANAGAASAPTRESSAKVAGPKAVPVTITGCLERADETFRLKETTGVDAPKSRSWKSAFLKKGSASIEVVEAANGLELPGHVGQRVSVTGTLVDRKMQVRSLQRVAASCADSSKVSI